MERRELMAMSREELISRAEKIGVPRPRALTAAELTDEILARTAKNDKEKKRLRGWLGRARDLLASVVERGLHLPDAAKALRQQEGKSWPPPPPPMPTVTLAEIYAAQGHLSKAIGVLDDVLAKEPDHEEARALRDRWKKQLEQSPSKPQPEATSAESARAESSSAREEAKEAKNGPAAIAKSERKGAAAATATVLPDRYDVDEVVALAVDPATLYLYWEVRPTTLARARTRRPRGRVVVRVASVLASWDGPKMSTRDEEVDALTGDCFVAGVAPGSDVRVTVGFRDGAEFEPFAVGVDVSMPRAAPSPESGRAVGHWRPAQAVQEPAPPSPPLAHAIDRASEARRLVTRELPLGGAALEDDETIEVDEKGEPRVLRRRTGERWRMLGASDMTRWDVEEEWIEEGPFGKRVVRYRRRRLGASEQMRMGASEMFRFGASERVRMGLGVGLGASDLSRFR